MVGVSWFVWWLIGGWCELVCLVVGVSWFVWWLIGLFNNDWMFGGTVNLIESVGWVVG